MNHDLLDPDSEHTLLLVKPDGYRRGLTGEILRRIEAKGYVLRGLKVMVASRDLLEEHYAEHRGKGFFDPMVAYMSSGPVVAVVIEGQRVVEGVRALMGSTDPTTAPVGTIRGDLGRAWDKPHVENLVHGSDSPESARREIKLWFPELV
ncbi:nucleoside-diphosphate kinase [Schaalia vaccimaxillae]|uniref:nucleoside-diphosphate kinase n=1 Tax=Schaalia vaccimaxillae TaxID=183916 RepID=UPI0003B59875|nr:nucleoside-diphosphate kinase [Schaalia vaccimaxillae]